MGLIDGFRWLVGRDAPVQERDASAASGSIEDLVGRLGLLRTRPWMPATPRSAMGVPAVFKALTLISNTCGTLSMEAYRNGAKLSPDETPRLVIRPDPFTPPYDFWRDTTFDKARLGETWLWIARRDVDGIPISVLRVDPREVTVETNPRNALRPIIKWLGTEMPNDDMRLLKYLPDPNNPYRGIGPLQACGAAVSVAVEAQEYAANFFAGSPATTWIKAAYDIDADEATAMKAAWVDGSSGLPKVTGPSVEDVRDIGVDPSKAQLSEVRYMQNGEVALMFSIPGTLLEHAVQGVSITYQNVGQEADKFLRECLLPIYLEPMEQVFSDMLTRATVSRFNVEGLRRADIKTRYDVHAIAITNGIYDATEAARQEGFVAGDVENRPVPFAAPQAIPASLPVERSAMAEVRCDRCGRMAGKVAGHAEIKCAKCGHLVIHGPTAVQERAAPDRDTDRLLEGIAQIAARPITVHSPVTIAPGAIQVAMPPPAPEPNMIELEYNEHHQLIRARGA